MKLVVNTVIEWVATETSESILERVLWIDMNHRYTFVMSLTAPNCLPVQRTCEEIEQAIENKMAIRRTVDPFYRSVSPDSRFLERHKERWESAWQIIEQMVEDEPNIYLEDKRGSMVRWAIEEFQTTKMTVYKHLRRYWRGGKTKYALLPDYHRSGAPGKERKSNPAAKRGRPSRKSKQDPELSGVNVSEDMKRIFAVATHRFYETKQKTPLKRAYKLMIGEYFNIGWDGNGNPVLPAPTEYPTFGQYKYWFQKEFNLIKSVTSRVGDKEFALRNRAILGDSTHMAKGPGDIFQIDATIGDVYLVSSYDRSKIIGRPVIYVVIDVFSRMIVGFSVGLSGPSWEGAALAIANTTMNKKLLCGKYDIEIEETQWPSCHLPKAVLADRGELLSKASDNLLSLGIKPLNTPPYRADWKGIVEQTFRIANLSVIHWLPGSTQGRFRKRGEPDNRLDATLDLKEFTQVLIKLILTYNSFHYMDWYQRDEYMIQQEVTSTPIELWNWGIGNRSGYLTQMPDEVVRLQLLPRETATITTRGIRYKGMYYSCERAIREQWFERARKNGTWAMVASNDVLTDKIFLHLDDRGTMEACTLLERESRYKGRRFEDVLELFEMEKAAGDSFEGNKLQADITFESEVNKIVREAEAKTRTSRPESLSKKARTSNIKANRAEEIKRMAQERRDSRHGEGETKDKQSHESTSMQSIPESTLSGEVEGYSSTRKRDLAILKRLQGHSDKEE